MIALVAFLPVAFFATRSSEALNPDIQNQFDLAIDTEVSGNGGSSLGGLDPCTSVNQGDFFDVDLVVRGVGAPGIAALSGDIIYDPAILSITGVEHSGLMLDGVYYFLTDGAQRADGDFRIDALNFQLPHNTGDGAILRLTFEALSSGGSTITWDDNHPVYPPSPNGVWDGSPDVWYVDAENMDDPDFIGFFPNMRARGAEVMVGSPCPGNLLDGDGDGWGDVLEDSTETLAVQACPDTAIPNDEEFDSWPPDFDNTKKVDIVDVLALKPVYGTPSARHDLNASGGDIDIVDVLALKPVFMDSCG